MGIALYGIVTCAQLSIKASRIRFRIPHLPAKMALPSAAPMETAQHLSSTSDLEQRVARIADPNIGLLHRPQVFSCLAKCPYRPEDQTYCGL